MFSVLMLRNFADSKAILCYYRDNICRYDVIPAIPHTYSCGFDVAQFDVVDVYLIFNSFVSYSISCLLILLKTLTIEVDIWTQTHEMGVRLVV